MDGLLEIAVIIGMFVLRLGVPLLITLLVGVWLRRLDDKWQAEAEAYQEAESEAAQQKQVPVAKTVNSS